MIKHTEITDAISKKDGDTIRRLLAELRPDLRKRAEKERNIAALIRLLAAEAHNPKVVREVPKIKVISAPVEAPKSKVVITSRAVDADGDSGDAYSFPEHYPPVLCAKLIEASRMTYSKRKLSNQLARCVSDSERASVVQNILALSARIDAIYEAKRIYDRYGYLPKEWQPTKERRAESKEELSSRLNSVRRRIGEIKAKLNNPAETEQLGNEGITKLRNKLAKYEQEKTEISEKLYQLSKT